MLFASTVLAQPPQLDHIIYGLFDYGCGEISMDDGFRVQARKLDGTVLTEFRIGSDIDLANHFVLRVPMSLQAAPDKAVSGEELQIVILDIDDLQLFNSSHLVDDIGTFAGKDVGDGQGGDKASAGVDQFVCALSTTLHGNQPVFGTGEWTILSGSGGLLAEPSSPVSEFSGQIGETYLLQWTITSQNCPTSTDQVEVVFSEVLTQADAGEDMQVCGSETQLAANMPITGEGLWTLHSGGDGVFEDPYDPHTVFYGDLGKTYELHWTISGGSCDESVDEVFISFNAVNSPELTVDGPLTSFCSQGVTLEASEGYDMYQWSHGPTTRVVHVEGVGVQTFTVTGKMNSGCERLANHVVEFVPENPDQIEVVVNMPTQTMCSLAAPFELRSVGACGGTGPFSYLWELISAPPEGGFIEEPTSSSTILTPYGEGVYEIQLTVEDANNQTYTVAFRLTAPHLEDNNGDGIFSAADWWFRVAGWQENSFDYPWLDADGSGSLNILDLLLAHPCEASYPNVESKREAR